MPNIQQLSASDPSTTLVLESFSEGAPVMQDLNATEAFYTRSGASDTLREGREVDAGDIWRDLNTDNNPNAANVGYVTGQKKIVSFTPKVDRMNEARGQDIDSELAYETEKKSEDAGQAFQQAFFEGDSAVNSKSINGLRALTPSSNVFEPADPLVLPLGGDSVKQAQQMFFEKFLNWTEDIPGGATHAYVNNTLANRMLMAAKNIGYYNESKDELGDRVDMIDDIVIRKAGHGPDGDRLLPFTETFGASNTTSSIFACRYGTRRNLTILTSEGGFIVRYDEEGNHIVHHVNADMAPILQEPNALQQMRGVALTA